MARIAGVNIPTAKRVEIGLQYIHGIGPAKAKEICGKVGIELARRVNTLSDDEVIRIRETIDRDYTVEGVCDVCGNKEFTRRKDDNAETVKTRMAAYRAQTEPLLPYYGARGVLRKVDGMAEMDAVYRQISAVLAGT